MLLPDGLLFVFGSVSCRRSDVEVLRTSGLNDSLFFIRQGLFVFATGAPISCALFGDTVLIIDALACIVAYFLVFGARTQLTDEEKKYNGVIKATRSHREKYGLTNTLFCVCNSKEGMKLARKSVRKRTAFCLSPPCQLQHLPQWRSGYQQQRVWSHSSFCQRLPCAVNINNVLRSIYFQ